MTKPKQKSGGFMCWLNLRGFMDTHEEWHAFVHGLCEVVCPWPPLRRVMSTAIAAEVSGEYHYYVGGRACGVLAWVGIVALFKVVLT